MEPSIETLFTAEREPEVRGLSPYTSPYTSPRLRTARLLTPRPTPPQFVDTTPIDAIPGREAPLHAALSRDDSAALAAAAAARAPLTLGEQLAFPSVAAMDYMRSTGIAADGVSRGGAAAKTAPRTQPSSYHALFTTAAF